MDILSDSQVLAVIVAGLAGLSIACVLWALRIYRTTEGAQGHSHRKIRDLRRRLARADSVFSAYPGVVMVWEDGPPGRDQWGAPRIYGAPAALASLLEFADDSSADAPADRILDGLGDLEARDAHGRNTSLRQCLNCAREEGTGFSLTVTAPSGQFLAADGRAAGSRLILWMTDTTMRQLSESNARVKLERTRQILSGHAGTFLEILDKVPMPVWRLDGQGRVQWANRAYLHAVDAETVEQVVDKDALFDRNIAKQSHRSLVTSKQVAETLRATISGKRRTLRVVTLPISGGIAGIAQDVTEEQALRDRLELQVGAHGETLNRVADAVAIFGPDHKLYFHNRAFETLWDLDSSFLLERPSHGSLLDRLRERGKLPAHSNYAMWRAEELSYYRPGGGDKIEESLWSLPNRRTVRVTRQLDPSGGLIMLFQDISTELDLQARYTSLLRVQQATLDNLQAIAVFRPAGELALHNKNFGSLWNIDPRMLQDGTEFDTVADACLSLFPDRAVWATIKARVTDPDPEARQKFDGEMKRADNKIVSFFTQPLPNGATLIAFKDESDARRSEELLRERADVFEAADRLKTEFVRNVSRELRSPLTTILGYSEMLRDQGELPQRLDRQIGYISEAAGQLSRLVTDILDLAMIDAGHMQLEVTEFNLAQVIGDSVTMAVSGAADTEVAIDVRCPADIGPIEADERRIRQILFNLLTNALRFTEPGDSISVSVEKTEGVLCLEVRDTGCGLAHDKQVAAFSAFNSYNREGVGIGLALVESFVRLHGGWVAMKSEPGEGTSILCFLPERAAPSEPDPGDESENENDREAA